MKKMKEKKKKISSKKKRIDKENKERKKEEINETKQEQHPEHAKMVSVKKMSVLLHMLHLIAGERDFEIEYSSWIDNVTSGERRKVNQKFVIPRVETSEVK